MNETKFTGRIKNERIANSEFKPASKARKDKRTKLEKIVWAETDCQDWMKPQQENNAENWINSGY